ncbi:MAG: DUF362 domain-containing protein [Candidatus Omnitrophica bacterium]|nr:DUF362 domain-containing protein [Candidatus Omnitrophota bacterium]
MASKVALVKCRTYNSREVDGAVEKALDLLGGIESIIKPNSKVLIKPNLLTDSAPEDCITTHPQVVESVISLVKKTNADIYVGDSPGVIGQKIDVDRVYEKTGMKESCKRQNVKLAYFDKAVLKNNIPVADWIGNCDYIINVPKFKTHGLTTLTGAIKNLFGLVMGVHKTKIHKDYFKVHAFSNRVVDVFELAKPALNIVDGIVAIEGDGPGSSGTRKDVGLIAASQDAVAIDSVLAAIMGLFPKDILTTKEAARRNLGESDIEKIDMLGENLGEFADNNFKLPSLSIIYSMPEFLFNIAKKFVWHKMYVCRNLCKSCGRCIGVCPVGAVSFKKNKAFIDYKKCILCACCQEICPYKSIIVQRSLLLKIVGV